MKRMLMAAVIAGITATAAEAQQERVAQFRGGDQPAPMARIEMVLSRIVNSPELAAKVGISEENVKKIKDAQFEFRKRTVSLRAEAETARLEVEQMMQQEKVNRKAVLKAVDVASDKTAALKKAEIEHMLDMKEIVGPEAIEKIKATMRDYIQQHKPVQGGMEQAPQQGQLRRPMQGGVPGADGRTTRPWLNRQQQQTQPPPPAQQQ